MEKRVRNFVKIGSLVCLTFIFILSMGTGSFSYAAEPIKIGAVLSVTGYAGQLGTAEQEAITIATEKVNREGGINGRKVEIYFEDDQSNPTNSAIAATKLIRDKKVCCVIGSTLTTLCMAMLPIFEQEGVPNVSLGAGHEITFPLKKWIFRIPATDLRLSPIMLKFTVNTLGAKKIGLLHSTDASGMMGAKGVLETASKFGASVILTENFDPKDTNMIPQLTKMKAVAPDAIILYTVVPPATVIAKNYQQLGMKTPVIASHGVGQPEFAKITGKIVEGGVWIFFNNKTLFADKMPLDDPYRKNIAEPFMKALKEKYGKTELHGFHGNGYDGFQVAINALKIAGTDDRAAIRDAMEKVSFQGLLANFKYSPTDHDGQQVEESLFPLIIKDGGFWPYKK